MREIQLTKGCVALVDDEDFEELDKYNWYAQPSGDTWYARRAAGKGKIYTMHRVIMCAADGIHVDHIDWDGLNNQKHNLRFATKAQNVTNTARAPGICGYRGVSFRGTTFQARITKGGIIHELGSYALAEEAARAWDKAAREFHGEFAVLNFPEED